MYKRFLQIANNAIFFLICATIYLSNHERVTGEPDQHVQKPNGFPYFLLQSTPLLRMNNLDSESLTYFRNYRIESKY